MDDQTNLLRKWPTGTFYVNDLLEELYVSNYLDGPPTKAQVPKLDRTGWKPDPASSSAEISVVLFDQYPSWWN